MRGQLCKWKCAQNRLKCLHKWEKNIFRLFLEKLKQFKYATFAFYNVGRYAIK